MNESTNSAIQKGVQAMEQGNTLVALMEFEEAAKTDPSPIVMAYHGHMVAVERHEFRKGLALCKQAVEKEPNNSNVWLILGRTLLVTGNKRAAIKAFRQGLKLERNLAITAELKQLGKRKSPVIDSLDRSHPVNRYLGKIFNKLGLR